VLLRMGVVRERREGAGWGGDGMGEKMAAGHCRLLMLTAACLHHQHFG
jgi:hypothetical protein